MNSWGLDLLSKLAESTSLDAVREEFPRKSDEGLSPAEFLAMVRRHVSEEEFEMSIPTTSSAARRSETDAVANKVGEVFKQMDVRGDGEVSWEDFSGFMLQMELMHDKRGAAENEHWFKSIAAHLGLDGHVRGGRVLRVNYLPASVEKLSLITEGNEVVHLLGQGPLPDEETPFRVETGGASDLARIACSLRHDTAYKPHEVHAVHSVPGQDVVITSSSLGPRGPHFLTVWDLPTEEERSSEKQFLPALTCREETPTRQTVIYWAPAVEMVLTGSSGNGSLLGWDLNPLKQSAKIWLHDAGITQVHELVGHAGGAPHLVTASLDGTIAVCGGSTKETRGSIGGVVLQRIQAHERGVESVVFCLQHSLALSVGVFVNAVETPSDILVWGLDRSSGLLANDIRTRLRGHEGQVVGVVFLEDELEVVTGSADATFLVWHVPALTLKQRFTRCSSSPMVGQSVSSFALVPKAYNRPHLLVAGMWETGGLELYARVEQRVHEALLKAEYCPYLHRFVTVSGRRVTVWDGKTGEALTTLTSERLLGNPLADISAFSLDHQGHKLVVGADTGEIRACLSHSGSLIRHLDPHDGPVNWLSFASRKTDKCIFSIGDDGALQVLDDADPRGYVKPSHLSSSDRRKKPVRLSLHHHSKEGYADPHCRDDTPNPAPVSNIHSSTNAAGRKTRNSCIPTKDSREEGEGRSRMGKRCWQSGTSNQNGGGRDGERSVLLRRVTFVSYNSDEEEEGEVGSNRQRRTDNESNGFRRECSRPVVVDATRRLKPQSSVDRLGLRRDREHPHREDMAINGVFRPGNGPHTPSKSHSSASRGRDKEPESVFHDDDRTCRGRAYVRPRTVRLYPRPVYRISRLLRAAARLTSSSYREDLLQNEVPVATKLFDHSDLPVAKPRQDITACAADDHLNVIATVATSDGGPAPVKIATVTRPSNCHPCSNDDSELGGSHGTSRVVGPSSSLHLWDAEVMTLLGTLLFPCLPLTRDATRHPTKSHIGRDSALGESDTAVFPEKSTTTNTPVEETLPATVAEEIAASPTRRPSASSVAAADGPTVAAAPESPIPSPTAVQADTGIGRPLLVTALAFLSPYPLLAGASTGGAVALWRVPDCVCVQALLTPSSLVNLRRKGGEIGGTEVMEVEHLTCLARGRCISPTGEELTVLYAGNERGDIVATRFSASELATLCGEAQGPVSCQRRANHNPYRHVRVKLTPQKANISLRAAYRAQRQEAAGIPRMGAGGGCDASRRAAEGATKAGDEYNFAVSSSVFCMAWLAHSMAISSISWIDSPASLLSASADGLAKIWTSDGKTLLGQLDINNKTPERSVVADGRRWGFVPGAVDHFLESTNRSGITRMPSDENTAVMAERLSGKAEDPNEAEVTRGILGRRGRRWQRRQRQQHQQPRVGDIEKNVELHPRESTRFPTSKPEGNGSIENIADKANGIATEVLRGRNECGSLSESRLPRSHHAAKSPAFSEDAKLGGRDYVTSMSGWNGMARELRDFEERLEASSLRRRTRADSAPVVRSSSRAPISTARMTPLHGKRWRTKSAPWSGEGGGVDRSVTEYSVGHVGATGDTVVAVTVKGYVKPRPGTAEEAAVKRSRRKDATGLITKDTVTGQAITRSLKGRPLEEWRAIGSGDERFASLGGCDTSRLDSIQDFQGGIPNAFPHPSGPTNPEIGIPIDHAATTMNSLRPVAILACSRGKRLVASGITVAVGQGGGFDVKSAQAAANETVRAVTTGKELGHDAIHKYYDEKETSSGVGRRRRQMNRRETVQVGGEGGDHKKRGETSSQAVARDTKPKTRSTEQLKHREFTTGHRTRANVDSEGRYRSDDSVEQSSFVFSTGSCSSAGGGSVGERGGSMSGILTGNIVQERKKRRGITGDNVASSFSRGASGSTPSYRGRGGDGPGQGETIRRLVHMGLF